MKVVFLCGGVGKRMAPIMEDKFMLNFTGKTLLDRHIDMAKAAGAKKFLFICNPTNEQKVREAARRKKVSAEFAIQKEPKGMADAILSAKRNLFEDALIVNPNDVVEPLAYKVILEAVKKNKGKKRYAVFLVGRVVERYFPGGYFVVNKNDEMQGLIEKPGEDRMPSRLFNIVLHYFAKPRDFVKYLETTTSDKDDVYEKAVTHMARDGTKIKVVRYKGFWGAIKYPWHIYDIATYFMNQIKKPQVSRKARIAKTAVVEGPVVIEEGVKVMEGATVKGPAYLGKDSIVGTNALVRESHLGDKNVVGFATEIARSYVGDENWFHTAYVGDSIIMNRCNLASGTVLANWRFDAKPVRVMIKDNLIDSGRQKLGAIIGSDCKTGVNSCIMPGVKIGPNSAVGPGVVLSRDLDAEKVALLKQEHTVIEKRRD